MEASSRFDEWISTRGLIRPRVGDTTFVDLAQALATMNGLGDGKERPQARSILETIGETDHLVFVLVDALGVHFVDELPESSFLRGNMDRGIRSVYPSSTAPALTSLATAAWPGAHAVTSWWTRLPEFNLTATILPFVDRYTGEDLAKLNVTMEKAFPQTSLSARFKRNVRSFLPSKITESTYSRYVRGDFPVTGYTTFPEAVDQVLEETKRLEGPTFHYLYYPGVDAASHDFGPDSPEARGEVALAEKELGRLREGLPSSSRMVVSADHGQIRITDENKHHITPDDELMTHLKNPPAGEPRVSMFHVKDGMQEAFAAAFRGKFSENFLLLGADEVEELELMGPDLSEEAKRRIGDFITVSDDHSALFHGPLEPKSGEARMNGYHGGLTEAEMTVPLIVA